MKNSTLPTLSLESRMASVVTPDKEYASIEAIGCSYIVVCDETACNNQTAEAFQVQFDFFQNFLKFQNVPTLSKSHHRHRR